MDDFMIYAGVYVSNATVMCGLGSGYTGILSGDYEKGVTNKYYTIYANNVKYLSSLGQNMVGGEAYESKTLNLEKYYQDMDYSTYTVKNVEAAEYEECPDEITRIVPDGIDILYSLAEDGRSVDISQLIGWLEDGYIDIYVKKDGSDDFVYASSAVIAQGIIEIDNQEGTYKAVYNGVGNIPVADDYVMGKISIDTQNLQASVTAAKNADTDATSVIIASYNAEGGLTGLEIKSMADGEAVYDMEIIKETEYVKAYIWNLDILRPMSYCVISE